MLTSQEREQLKREIKEECLLALPSVIGNLMAESAAFSKLNAQFYASHPEFREHKQLVAQLLEKIDGENPGMELEKKLEKVVPEVREAIRLSRGLDVTKVATEINDRRFKGGGSQGVL